MAFDMVDTYAENAVIKVIGVGGGGGNALEHMVLSQIEGVDFICANTDVQALRKSSATTQLQLGTEITKGLGAGAKPEVGRQAALEDRERIMEVIEGADMVFITAGMGGGTGTGAAPVVAEVAKEMGILTVAVVTKPFPFEGKKRLQIADAGIEALGQHVDSLITIPNGRLMEVLGNKITMIEAFAAANDVLLGAVQGIADLITQSGMINVDFADVRTVMSEMGMAMMGTGLASGEGRAETAARNAAASPLLDDVNLKGARGVLVNITASEEVLLMEIAEVGDIVQEFASDDATVVTGTAIDPDLGDEIKVTIVATGLPGTAQKTAAKPAESTRLGLVKKETVARVTAVESGPKTAMVEQIKTPVKATVPIQEKTETVAQMDLDYLDIPTFLRNQAD